MRRAKVPAALMALCFALASVCVAEIPLEQRRSGFDDMSRETQAVQADDAANPGMLWVLEGEALWSRKIGAADRACADCHGDARVSMRGVAARYPVFDDVSGGAINLEQRILQCRAQRQKADSLPWESPELLSLTAYVARQSHGLPIAPPDDARLQLALDWGRQLFSRRIGQLNLSCSQCHDDNWGKRLAGNAIPQGHPTGYPLYRLEWQAVGSLQRRLRGCMSGVRSEPYSYGSAEFVAIEVFLKERARGMPLETPAVRP